MTTYGPTSGITKAALFDTVVNNIDATLSGNPTGWSLVFDGRASSRIPTSDGKSPLIAGVSDTAQVTLNETTLGSGGTRNGFKIMTLVREGPTYYGMISWRDGSTQQRAIVSSIDGRTFTQLFPNTAPLNLGKTYSSAPVYMGDGKMWFHAAHDSGTNTMSLFADSLGGAGWTASGVTQTKTSNNGTIITGTVFSEANGRQYPTMYPYKHSDTKCSFFVRGKRGATTEIWRYTLEGADYATAMTNWDTEVTTNAFQKLTDNAALSCDEVIGVVNIVDVAPDVFDITVRVRTGTVEKHVILRLSQPIHPATSVPYSTTVLQSVDIVEGLGTTTSPDLDKSYSYTLRDSTDVLTLSLSYDTGFSYENTTPTQQISFAVSGSADSSGSVPDVKGLDYEYCVLQSDYTTSGDTYNLVLLQLDPNQVGTPTVTGMTDRNPILARLVRGFDPATLKADKFFFDPIDAANQVAIAPAVFTIPTVGASPEETFRYWMRVDQRQVFLYCESTNGTDQMLHVNITDKVIPYGLTHPADNFVATSAGALAGVGGIYLGRGGATESDTLDLRGDAKVYYPRAMETTYSTILSATNTVDGRDVQVDVFSVNNSATFGSAPSADLFLVGRLYDTKYETNNAGLSSGDTSVILGDTYMFFRASTTADTNDDATVKEILVKWD